MSVVLRYIACMGPLFVTAPITGSAEYWSSVSMWDAADLPTADVATMLKRTEAAVRQALRRDTTGFPPSAVPGTRHRWSARQIYDYVRNRQRRRHSEIPTVFPDVTDRLVQPAVLVAAEQWRSEPSPALPDAAAWSTVVQYWRPCDGRDIQLAVLYPVAAGHRMSRAGAVEVATRYAQQAFASDGGAAAVVMITDETRPAPGGGEQAAVIVVESAPRMYPPSSALRYRAGGGGERPGVSVYEIGWFDLAAAFRTDLPWWPPVLRSAEVMVRWRPGQTPVAVPPRDDRYRPEVLGAVAAAAHERGAVNAPVLDAVVARANRRIEDQLCPPGTTSNASYRPGLVLGAVPDLPEGPVPAALAAIEVAWLLQQPSPGMSTAADVVWRLPESRVVVAEIGWLPKDSWGDMAAQWVARLEPAEHWSVGHELVHAHGRMGTAENGWVRPAQDELSPLVDPFNRAVWAVRTEDGAIHYTVGQRAGCAQGRLVEAEIHESWSFFRDSAGVVWPFPRVPRFGGSSALAETVYLLRQRADVDVVPAQLVAQAGSVPQRALQAADIGPQLLRQIDMGAQSPAPLWQSVRGPVPGLSRLLNGPAPWRLSAEDLAGVFGR